MVQASRTLTADERLAALAAALPIASRTEAAMLGQELVEAIRQTPIRGRKAGCFAAFERVVRRAGLFGGRTDLVGGALQSLLRQWCVLPVEIRSAAVDCADDRLRSLASGGLAGVDGAAEAKARLVGDLGEAALAGLLLPMLIEPRQEAAGAAEESLARLAALAAGCDPRDFGDWREWEWARRRVPAPMPQERRELHARIAVLATAYGRHRRPGVLKSAMVLLDPATVAWCSPQARDPLARWFSDAGHESHMALRSALKKCPGALARQRAWEWLGRSMMTRSCCERLMGAGHAEEHEVVLARAHLVHNPVRSQRLRQIRIEAGALRTGRGIVPRPAMAAGLSVAARRGLAQLAPMLRLPADASEALTRALAADRERSVRQSVLRAMPHMAAPLLMNDDDEGLARCAALHVVYGGSRVDTQQAEKLASSGHARLARLWREEGAASELWDYACERSRLAARRWLRDDHTGFIAALRQRVRSEDAAVSAAAMMLARRLGVTAQIELELLGAAAGATRTAAQERAVATAVAALGEVCSDAGVAAVRACTEHPLPRVRANALEALARSGAKAASELVEFKRDASHRVRASVLRALLHRDAGAASRAAADELLAMLGDERPLHRLAGLWVMERVLVRGGLGEHAGALASQVALLAREEAEVPIRLRAARCARLMLAQMRQQWHQRAAALGDAA
jgi:hypothetical protein